MNNRLTFKKETENKFKRNNKLITVAIAVITFLLFGLALSYFVIIGVPESDIITADVVTNISNAYLSVMMVLNLFNVPMMGLKISNGLKATYITKQKMNDIEMLKMKQQIAENDILKRKIKKFVKKDDVPVLLEDYVLSYCKTQYHPLEGVTFYKFLELVKNKELKADVKVNSIVSLLTLYGIKITPSFEKSLYNII
jgi:hypothetical protein